MKKVVVVVVKVVEEVEVVVVEVVEVVELEEFEIEDEFEFELEDEFEFEFEFEDELVSVVVIDILDLVKNVKYVCLIMDYFCEKVGIEIFDDVIEWCLNNVKEIKVFDCIGF